MSITAQTAKQAVIDLVNKDNTTAFTAAQLTLAAPTPINGAAEGERNTTVAITGTDATELPGNITVTYTRQPASQVFADGLAHEFSKTDAVAADVTAEVVSALLTGRPVPFDVGSYTIDAVALDPADPLSQDGKYNWTVAIDLSAHYVLFGSVTVLVNSKKAELSDIKTTELSGFTASDVAAS